MAKLEFTRGSLPVFRRRFNPCGKLLAQAEACGFLVELPELGSAVTKYPAKLFKSIAGRLSARSRVLDIVAPAGAGGARRFVAQSLSFLSGTTSRLLARYST